MQVCIKPICMCIKPIYVYYIYVLLYTDTGVELEFVQMATQWLGYMPQSNVEQLIAQKEQVGVGVEELHKRAVCLFLS
jgi:hypothetical protein